MRSKLYQNRKYDNLPMYKYSFDRKVYNLNDNSTPKNNHSKSVSFDTSNILPDTIKSKPRFSIGKNSSSLIGGLNNN